MINSNIEFENLFQTQLSYDTEESILKLEALKYNPEFDPVKVYGNQVKLFKGMFPLHATVSWDSIIDKIEKEYDTNFHRLLYKQYNEANDIVTINEPTYNTNIKNNISFSFQKEVLPSVVTHTMLFSDSKLQNIILEAKRKLNINFLHLYISFISNSYLFDRHKDDMSSIIIAGKNKVSYAFDDNKEITLEPGDGIFIPKNVYHKPKIYGARITFSYCWNYVK